MVKRKGGKYGFRTGATLRSKFSPRSVLKWRMYDSYVQPQYHCTKKLRLKRLRKPQDSKEGVLIKHVFNVYDYKKEEIEEMMQEGSLFYAMDKIDGLNYPTKNAVEFDFDSVWETDSVVEYSLGKKKRWLLPRLIKESFQNDVLVKEKSRVVTIKRRVHVHTSKFNSKDCFEVFDGKTGKIHQPTKKSYDRLHNLYKHVQDVQLRYEFGFPYERRRWPHNQQTKRKSQKFSEYDEDIYGHYHYTASKNKAYRRQWLVKCGTIKRRIGKIAGRTRRELLEDAREYELLQQDNHLQQDFEENINEVKLEQDQISHSRNKRIELADFLRNKKPTKSRDKIATGKPVSNTTALCNSNRASSAQIKMYGKGSAIFVDKPVGSTSIPHKHDIPETEQKTTSSTGLVQNQPIQPLSKVLSTLHSIKTVGLQLRSDSIIPSTLKELWKEFYQEAKSTPRKFIVDITPKVRHCINRQQNVYIIFEPECNFASETTHVKTWTSLVLDVEAKAAGVDMIILNELFVSSLKTGMLDIHSVEDVVNTATTCIQSWKNSLDDDSDDNDDNAVLSPKPEVPLRKTLVPLAMLTDLFNWKFEFYTVDEALVEMKTMIGQKHDVNCNISFDEEQFKATEMNCGICYEELFPNNQGGGLPVEYTALKECGHVFCNSCWQVHLITKITNGSTSLQCPEYKCNSVIDDVTVMALVPTMYSKWQNHRASTLLEIDPLWQWCPGKTCRNVIKAERCLAIPVECCCGTVWCFKCQKEAHWPATCDQASKFLELAREYEDLLGRTDSITSVQIKRCPFCKYPIEKNEGCPHMICMMCNKDFCWECLKPFNDSEHYWCETTENTQDVLLSFGVGSETYEKYLKVALANRLARNRSALRKIRKDLINLKEITSAFQFLDSFFKQDQSTKPLSTVHNLLEMFVTNNIAEQYKAVTEFKLQAQFVLEGAAKFVGFSVNTKQHRKLAADIANLEYVVKRVEDILQDCPNLCRDSIKPQLQKLLYHGREYIYSIGSHCHSQ